MGIYEGRVRAEQLKKQLWAEAMRRRVTKRVVIMDVDIYGNEIPQVYIDVREGLGDKLTFTPGRATMKAQARATSDPRSPLEWGIGQTTIAVDITPESLEEERVKFA